MKEQIALTISGYGQLNPKGIPSGDQSQTIIANTLIALMIGAALLTLVYLLWAGINWVMSDGDKAKITQARNKITYAIIGLIVIFLAFFLVSSVASLFGLPHF